jgi:hypothetical protein
MIDDQVRERLETLRDEIARLNTAVSAREAEIQGLIVGSVANFEGSYVRFYDGTNYVFMGVERQIIRGDGSKIVLTGPSLTLSDDPLNFQDGDDGLDFGIYKEDDEIAFSAGILEGRRVETIDEICGADMTRVIDCYLRTARENLLRGIYNKK